MLAPMTARSSAPGPSSVTFVPVAATFFTSPMTRFVDSRRNRRSILAATAAVVVRVALTPLVHVDVSAGQSLFPQVRASAW
jgi:hypothetical protein